MSKKPPKDQPVDADAKSAKGGLIGLITLGAAALMTSFGVAFVFSPGASQSQAACNAADEPTAALPLSGEERQYVELEEILITIGSAPATRYVKMNLTIVTVDGGQKSIESNKALLKDAFNNYLRSVEVSDFENPAFYIHMREQLARRAELVLGGSVSQGVLITEFLLR
jgi:flagellar protein FliL